MIPAIDRGIFLRLMTLVSKYVSSVRICLIKGLIDTGNPQSYAPIHCCAAAWRLLSRIHSMRRMICAFPLAIR